MQKETSNIHKYLYKGKQLPETPYYFYCINQRIEKKYNVFSSLTTPCTSIVYPPS